MPQTRKTADDDVLLEISGLEDKVVVGPDTRELGKALEVSNATAFRSTNRLIEAGLVKHGYRGLVLTPEGRKRVNAIIAEQTDE